MATRAAAVVSAIGTPGGSRWASGPSHQPVIEGMLGIPYDTPGRHTEEYVQVLAPLLRGEQVSFHGDEFGAVAGPRAAPGRRADPRAGVRARAAPLPRRRRARRRHHHVDGQRHGHRGTCRAPDPEAAAEAGRPEPRIVAGLPVAVHDDVAEARGVAAQLFACYGKLPELPAHPRARRREWPR